MYRRIIFLVFFVTTISFAKADIGETFDMQQKRENIIKENERILSGRHIDSLSNAENSRYIENLHIIRLLDEDIFKSQKETIDRLSGSTGYDQYINKSIALFCFALAVMLSLSLYMLYLMNNKLNKISAKERSFSAMLSELFAVLLVNFQPTGSSNKSVVVNRLIILGLLFMFISFLGYLLKTLGV